MYKKYILFCLLLILTINLTAQPPEIQYLGNLVTRPATPNGVLPNKGPFPIGFSFNYFGIPYTQFYLNANGLVMFTLQTAGYGTEAVIPTSDAPNNYIAPFWDDLVLDVQGDIQYRTIGSAPNRKLIIQYRNMGFYPNPPFFGTFSVILYETSNRIQVQYRQIVDFSSTKAHGESATIGIENSDGTAGYQYAYHSPSAISAGQAVSFTPVSPAFTTYSINGNAVYEGVYLTTNLAQPVPGITNLIAPPQNAVTGTDQTFEWSTATNAVSYSLKISTNSDLTDAVSYDAGANTEFDVTGLQVGTTYFWGVFATNATGTSWCEIKRFTTSATPLLTPVPETIWLEQGEERSIGLDYTGGDASTKTAIITTLPPEGSLYQYVSGTKGTQITSGPAPVTDTGNHVIYVADGAPGYGAGNFNFIIHDDTGDSPEGTITVNVSPPGIPNFLYAARNTNIEVQFDRQMNDPAGKEGEFVVKVNGPAVTINSASLKPGDNNTIILTLAVPLTGTDVVTVAYNRGTVSGVAGGFLETFTDQPVTLLAQTITFTTGLDKIYGDPPFPLFITATSALAKTYSSSDQAVATIAGNLLTINYTGTSVITAWVAGDAIYAPARYSRTLTVARVNQTITFDALSEKTYGDADFSLTATASSGLTVTYISNNNSVATVTGNVVHITGAGTAVITASQAGNSIWNPAVSVPQTLIVNKADQIITFDVLPEKFTDDADFAPVVSVSSGLTVTLVSNNPSVAVITGGMIHITGEGNAVITASQDGNTNYNAATPVQQPLIVKSLKANQTITFDEIPPKMYLDPDFNISAVASSGLPVHYHSSNNSVALITGNMIHIIGAGTAVITASQDGDSDYYAAPDVLRTFTVSKAIQVIDFVDLPERLLVGSTYELQAVSNSGVIVLFESSDELLATITENQVTGVARGDVGIRAYHEGNQNFLAGEKIEIVEIYSTHRDILYLITPNGDGINDLWELPELEAWGRCDVKVYNRWGKLVFADSDYNNLWEGTSAGSPLPEGAYYFVIKTENTGTVTGNLNIVR